MAGSRLPLIETLVDSLPVGVVLLDSTGKVALFNRFEERLARRDRDRVLGLDFFSAVAPCTNVSELAGVFREKLPSNTLDETVEFQFKLEHLPRARDVVIHLQSFPLDGQLYASFVVEDVTQRRQIERERDAFYSMLVHDLMGGLTGVLGYAELLATGSRGPLSEKQLEAVNLIAGAGERMNGLIQSALREFRSTVTEIEGERTRWEPVNLHALVLGTVGLLGPEAAKKDVALRYEDAGADDLFPTRSVTVLGDVDRLGALIDNLVTNALKYARTTVAVSLREELDEVHLVVRDDGDGIAEALREKVFEGGYQAPGSKPGHGIGLASVRRTAERHNGRAWADVAREGGAALHVRLPRHKGS
ncbi:MAG: PAS domain-containing sensor histidine kinase [Planctomycetota bacterium]